MLEADNRSRAISRDEETTVGTTGVAIAIPAAATAVKILTTEHAYAGVGSADTPPTASASNTGYVEDGTPEIWVFRQARDAYLYVYARTGTLDVQVTFYS